MKPGKMVVKARVLCLPLPLHGHINPVLQFCNRLASRGIHSTVLTSTSVDGSTQMKSNLITIESLPDSTDELPTPDDASWEKHRARYLKYLPMFIQNKAASGEPVKLVLFDSTLPWAMDFAEEVGIPGAIFFTQSCADCAIYCHLYKGTLKVPLEETNSTVSLPSLPPLEKSDLPSFIYRPESWPFLLRLGPLQNSVFHKADWIFINIFDDLESETARSLVSQYSSIRTIGPTIPSMYLDQEIKDDEAYAFSFEQNLEDCIKWLDPKPTGSVVYVSPGSLASPSERQMAEIALALANSNFHFLWVVRESEQSKLPGIFKSEIQEENGLEVHELEQSKLPSNFKSEVQKENSLEVQESEHSKLLSNFKSDVLMKNGLEVQESEQSELPSYFESEVQEENGLEVQESEQSKLFKSEVQKDNSILEVQESKQSKLQSNFGSGAHERGLIVSWCPQLEVLAHRAVGCFVTHSGWNSTLEALSLGVPMVAIPQWGDQPTNAKFVEDVWLAGVRAKASEEGIVTKEEIQIRIKEVMVGEKANMIKKNVLRWKELAKEAMSEGGSSKRNIDEFVSSFASA